MKLHGNEHFFTAGILSLAVVGLITVGLVGAANAESELPEEEEDGKPGIVLIDGITWSRYQTGQDFSDVMVACIDGDRVFLTSRATGPSNIQVLKDDC